MKLRQKRVFKVLNRYECGAEGLATGHWVMALDEKDALRVAKIYNIGKPMGTLLVKKRRISHYFGKVGSSNPSGFKPTKYYRGAKVWCELKGKLYYFDTPFIEQTELKEFEGEDRFRVSQGVSIDEMLEEMK